MRGGAIPFVDTFEEGDENLMYDDVGAAPTKSAKAVAAAPLDGGGADAGGALPDFDDFDAKPGKGKGGKDDVLGLKARAPRPKFTENHLMKAEGLEWLVKHMPKRAKCRHRDAAEDAARLVEGYRQWAAGLFPKLPLDDLLQRVETMGKKALVRNVVEDMRQNQRYENWRKRRRAEGHDDDEDLAPAGARKPAEGSMANALAEKKAAALALREAKAREKRAAAGGDDDVDEEAAFEAALEEAAAAAEAAALEADAEAEAAMAEAEMDEEDDFERAPAAPPAAKAEAVEAAPVEAKAAEEDSEEEFDFEDAPAAEPAAAEEAAVEEAAAGGGTGDVGEDDGGVNPGGGDATAPAKDP